MQQVRRIGRFIVPAWLRSRLRPGHKGKPRPKPEDILHVEKLAVVSQLACHSPFSNGSPTQRLDLTLSAASSCYQTLLQFIRSLQPDFFEARFVELKPCNSPLETSLQTLFNQNRSDKATSHSYHWLYSRLTDPPSDIKNVLEIGIGSNNPKVVSNMKVDGTPGASLRAWQQHMPNARIHGADVDPDILFQENRIECHHVDQLSNDSLEALAAKLGHEFDLIIDDGLHSIQANLQTLQAVLQMCRPMGWICIEDIFPPQADFFLVLSWILHQQGFESWLYRFDKPGMIFVVSPQRDISSFPE